MKRFSFFQRKATPLLLAVLVFMAGGGIEAGEKREKVIVEGIGAIIGGDKSIARDRALEDAMRRAVEQSVGTMVESSTLVENYQIVSDQIMTNSKGYIERYKVLSEKTDLRERVVRVRLEAEVALGDLKNDLAGLGLLLERKGKPRLMILVDERIGGMPNPGAQSEVTLIELLGQKGFTFVDKKVLDAGRGAALQKASSGESAAASVGQQYGAEVVVVGSAIARISAQGIAGTAMRSVQANLSLKAIESDTGNILAVEGERVAVAHISEETGGKMAIEKAVRTLAPRLLDKIVDQWRSEFSGVQTVKVVIKGVNFGLLAKIKRVFQQEIRGIGKVHQRGFSGGTATFELESKGSAQLVAEEISLKKFDGFALEVTGLSMNRIEIEVAP